MRTLYLLRSHGTAALDGEQLVVRHDAQELERTPLPQLDQILVMGQLQLTTPLIRACLGRGIPIAYLTRQGQCLGRLQPVGGAAGQAPRRPVALTDAQRLVAARALVAGTIGNARGVLQRLTREGGREAVEQTLRRLGQLQGLAKQTASLNQLRGLEGAALATYVRVLGSLLEGDGFGFTARSRRPPLTPFDALCGFGDGVLWNALQLRVDLRGLDPSLTVGKGKTPSPTALIAELMEPLRPFLLDPFHLQLIRARHLLPAEHFEASGHGTVLNGQGRDLWLNHWAEYIAEAIPLADGRPGPRWEVVDQLVQGVAQCLEDPEQPLWIPSFSHRPRTTPQTTSRVPRTPTHWCNVQSTLPLRTIGS
jgi:CRISPR-associated protein Cas1